jgi:hypothetical protein
LIAVVANEEAFMRLQPSEQKAIREAAATACAQQWKMTAAEDADALVKLKEKGLQFDPLPPETRAALHQATAVVVDDARKRLATKSWTAFSQVPAAVKPTEARPYAYTCGSDVRKVSHGAHPPRQAADSVAGRDERRDQIQTPRPSFAHPARCYR